jgi:hypothetical protein
MKHLYILYIHTCFHHIIGRRNNCYLKLQKEQWKYICDVTVFNSANKDPSLLGAVSLAAMAMAAMGMVAMAAMGMAAMGMVAIVKATLLKVPGQEAGLAAWAKASWLIRHALPIRLGPKAWVVVTLAV